MDARGWALLATGVAAGAALVLVSTAVRDAVLDAYDTVVAWWWDLVYRVQRAVLLCALLLIGGLAMWAVVALLLPRLADR